MADKLFLVHVRNSHRVTAPTDFMHLLTPDIREALKAIRDEKLAKDPGTDSAVLYELEIGKILGANDHLFFSNEETPRSPHYPVRMVATYFSTDEISIAESWNCPSCRRHFYNRISEDYQKDHIPACLHCGQQSKDRP